MNDPLVEVRNPHGIDLIKIAFRRMKVPQNVVDHRIIAGDCTRAGGDRICERCGLEYRDHPVIDGMEFLHVICDWRVYKL